MLSYGVFRLGQFWTVQGVDGSILGFPDREAALAAADLMARAHLACGEAVELVVQDDLGRLRQVSPPAD